MVMRFATDLPARAGLPRWLVSEIIASTRLLGFGSLSLGALSPLIDPLATPDHLLLLLGHRLHARNALQYMSI